MDRENLGIQTIFTKLTTEKLDVLRGETRQQMLTALCMMVVGLLLTFTGLTGLIVRLIRFAGCNILFVVRSIGTILVQRKGTPKVPLPE